ncbi:MAG: hypothetical protein H6737_09455 [Alphaproteobacteria bacterium]|nr:hypothetical protein [Alphaproteobacteria bacterium]
MRIESGRGFVLEHAVTGRSRCRGCRKPIDQGAPRFGAPEELGATNLGWFHPKCVKRDTLDAAELFERWEAPLPEVAKLLAKLRAPYEAPCPTATEVARAADRNDWDAVATGLRDLWWATRDPLPAGLLSELTALDIEDHPVPAKPEDAWLAALDPGDARQNGRRILGVTRMTKDPLSRAVYTACTDPPDPRWVDLVLGWFDDPPYSSAIYLWYGVLALLDRLADPRVLTRAHVLATDPDLATRLGGYTARIVSTWAGIRASHGYARVTAASARLDASDREALEGIREALERRGSGQAREARTRADLFHAAAAGDDGALLVLADLLVSAGDPRGELVQLALAGNTRTPAQRKRQKALEKRWREVVGELGPALLRDGLRFRRGLVVGAVATPVGAADLERVVQSVDWASVERLELRFDARHRIEPRLVYAPHARRLRSLVLPNVEAFEDVLDAGGVQPGIRELELANAAGRGAGTNRPYGLSALPGLTRVVLHGHDGHVAHRFPGLEIVES